MQRMPHRAIQDEPAELTTASALHRDLPWETYTTARLISDRDLQLIKKYDKRSRETQQELLEEAGPAICEAFLNVLRNVAKEETVQYVLALIDDMLAVDRQRAKLFHQQSSLHLANQPDPYAIFLRLLQRTDWFTQEKAALALTAILEARPNKDQLEASDGSIASASASGVEHTLATFTEWLCSQLRRPTHPRSAAAAVSALARLLRERPVRGLFHRQGGVQLLAPLLRAGSGQGSTAPPSQQLLYEAGLCVWQLTYYQPAAQAMGSTGIVQALVEQARTAQKEKVMRVAVLSLQNLLSQEQLQLGPDMVEAGLQKVVAQRLTHKWDDDELTAALEWLREQLDSNIQLLSSFEKYKKEVLSGSLDWTPMHTSQQFWRENVTKFEDRDFQVLRVLLKLLEASRETRTLAVGCHDLGQFITYHENGRNIITEFRGKELVMRLMMHPDPEVQKQALLCVQKIMLSKDKLDFMSSS
jgi:V-type H+-transporting ATPase subunit H